MSWTFDTQSQADDQTTNPVTVSHTCSANTTLLIITVFAGNNTSGSSGTPTWNTTESFVDSGEGFLGGDEAYGQEVFYLTNPTTGTHDVSVPNASANTLTVNVYSFEGTGAPFKDSSNSVDSGAATSANPSVTVTNTYQNDLMYGTVGSGARDTPSAGSGYQLLYTDDRGNQVMGDEYDLDSGTSTNITVDFTTPQDEDYVIIGISFRDAAAAQTSDNSPAFIWGGEEATPDNKYAYLAGGIEDLDNQPAYLIGSTDTLDNQEVYTKGQDTALDNQPAYIAGQADTLPVNPLSHIKFENGDLLEFLTYTDPDNDLSVTTDAAMVGNYGLEILIDDQNPVYGTVGGAPTSSGFFSIRFYLDPNGLTIGAGDSFTLVYTGVPLLLAIYLRNNAGSYQLQPYVIDDGTNWLIIGSTSNITDAPHCIEVQIQRAATADSENGRAEWFLDGVSKGSLNNIDLYTNWAWDDTQIGAVTAIDVGTSGTFYLDDIITTDAPQIGPANQVPAYLEGMMGAKDGQWAFLQGQDTASAQLSAFLAGGIVASDNQPAYSRGSQDDTDSSFAFLVGSDIASDNQFAYSSAQDDALDNSFAFTWGLENTLDNSPAFLVGGIQVSDNQPAYLVGSSPSTATFIAGEKAISTGSAASTTGVDTTGADFLLVSLNYWTSQDTFSDSKSNSWTWLGPFGASPCFIRIGYCINPTVGTNHYITDTMDYGVMHFYAFSGMRQDANVYDTLNSRIDQDAPTMTGEITPVETGELLFSSVVGSSPTGGEFTVDNGLTIEDETPYSGGINPGAGTAFLNTYGSTSPINVTWTDVVTGSNVLLLAAFRLAGGTPTSDNQYAYTKGQDTATDSQSAWLAGGIQISDNQAAYLAGGVETSDNQSAYTAGQNTSSDNQAAYIAGQDIGSDNQPVFTWGQINVADNIPAYLAGGIETLDNLQAYLAGGINTLDNQGAYAHGSINVADAQSAYLAGQDTASDGQLAYLAGLDNVLDNQPAFTLGQDTAQDAQSAYATGQDHTTSSNEAFLQGALHLVENTSVFLAGGINVTSSNESYLAGGIIVSSSVSAFVQVGVSSTVHAFIASPGTETSDNTSAYVAGQSDVIGSQASFLAGSLLTSDSRYAYTAGSTDTLDNTSAYLAGQDTASSQQSSYTSGQAGTTASQISFLAGLDTSSDSSSAYTAGQDSALDSVAAFLAGSIDISDSQYAYTAGSIDITDQQSAFVHGAVAVIDATEAYLEGYSANQSTQPAYLAGLDVASDAQQAYLVGGIVESDNQAAYTAGQSSTLGSTPVFLIGELDATTSQAAYTQGATGAVASQPAYLAGQSTAQSNSPAYIIGSLDATDGQAAYTAGQASSLASQAAYLEGSEGTLVRGSAPAYAKGIILVFDYSLEGDLGTVYALAGDTNIVYNLDGSVENDYTLEGSM